MDLKSASLSSEWVFFVNRVLLNIIMGDLIIYTVCFIVNSLGLLNKSMTREICCVIIIFLFLSGFFSYHVYNNFIQEKKLTPCLAVHTVS